MNEQQLKTPFFARFLESQESLQVRTDVKAGAPGCGKGGGGPVTLKYPSDDDEGGVPL